MEEKLLSAYSVEDIRKILHGPRDEIVQTRIISRRDGKGGVRQETWNLTRGEVLDAIESISKDKELIELILDDSRRATAEIKVGATSRNGIFPYFNQIESHFNPEDIYQREAFGAFIVSFAGSFVIQKFGNKEDL